MEFEDLVSALINLTDQQLCAVFHTVLEERPKDDDDLVYKHYDLMSSTARLAAIKAILDH